MKLLIYLNNLFPIDLNQKKSFRSFQLNQSITRLTPYPTNAPIAMGIESGVTDAIESPPLNAATVDTAPPPSVAVVVTPKLVAIADDTVFCDIGGMIFAVSSGRVSIVWLMMGAAFIAIAELFSNCSL